MNYTLLSALQHICSTKPQKVVCITSEEWVHELLLFAMQGILYKDILWKRTTPKAILKERMECDLFSSSASGGLFVETDQFGEGERKQFQKVESGPLLWVSSKQSVDVDNMYVLASPKPWERLQHAQEAVRFFLVLKKTEAGQKACQLLSQKAVSSPQAFRQEMEKYVAFASCGPIRDDELELLLESDSSSSLWALLDAFVLKKKQLFFQELVRVEEDNHPLQIIRFIRNQYEQLLRLSEGESVQKFKSKEKQLSFLRERSFKEKSKILQRLLLHDIGLRDGTVDEKLSLISFFSPFFG